MTTLQGLLLLATLSVLIGGLVARVARVRWLARVHPDVLPLQAALGTAVLTCVCATLSHAGVGQYQALPLVALMVAGLLTAGVLLRLRHRRHPWARWSAWWPAAAALTCVAVVGLLPLFWLHSFNPFNDAFYYDAISDWLLIHGVSEPLPHDSMVPAMLIAAQVRESGVRLGTSYVQAFLTGGLGVSHALLVFYAVSCWGFLLLAGCLYSLARRVFRLRPLMAAAAVCSTVCVPASSTFALQNGFQAQAYGLAALIAILIVGSALIPRRRWTAGGALVLGTLLAWQASVYSELAPAVAVAMLAWLAVTGLRARVQHCVASWARFAAGVALVFLLVANVEVLRALEVLPRQMASVVGHHITATPMQWMGLFAGSTIFAPQRDVLPEWNPLALPGGPILPLVLCLVFLVRRRGRPLEHGTAAVLLCFAVAATWFGFLAPDPWSGTPPHTWSLLRLAYWSQPLVIVCAWGCLGRWLRGPRAARTAAVLALVAMGLGLPLHARYAWQFSYQAPARFTGSDRPLAEIEKLSSELRALAGQPLYVVTRPHLTSPVHVGLLAYLSQWSPTAGLWTGCPYFNVKADAAAPSLTDVVPEGGRVTLVCQRPHFKIPNARRLACDVFTVPGDRNAVLCQVSSPLGVDWTTEREPRAWIGADPATLVVYAPHAGWLGFTCHVKAPPGVRTATATLDLSGVTSARERTVEVGDEHGAVEVQMGCDVNAGVNEIRLRCRGATAEWHAIDGRSSAVRVALYRPQIRLF
ncbi:MAG TPA: hypothetical protein VFY71_18165 [Planctomycetota bacterium]|nr:hypothetical protein [Planctomycetota bacterium]